MQAIIRRLTKPLLQRIPDQKLSKKNKGRRPLVLSGSEMALKAEINKDLFISMF